MCFNSNLQLPPQIFYGIKVCRLAGPLQDLNVLLLEPLLCCLGCVFWVIVMQEYPSTNHFQCPGWLQYPGQTTKNQVRNLGVILETDLSFSSHVKAVTKSAYYHLKNIARIRCFVSSHDLEKLVHAFITSRVDYCNGLLTGLPKKTIRQLQLIQNAAARILTRTRKSEHITPVLRSLHWLPVTFRIDFKVLLLVYKSLNGLGPKYMSDMLTEYKPNRPLRSLGSSQLEIPRVHTKQGESAFSYYAARSWNQLPEEIRCAKTLATFKSSLKTHLFSCAFVE